jgi:hypothetical protein
VEGVGKPVKPPPVPHVWILKEAIENAGVADRKKVAEATRLPPQSRVT